MLGGQQEVDDRFSDYELLPASAQRAMISSINHLGLFTITTMLGNLVHVYEEHWFHNKAEMYGYITAKVIMGKLKHSDVFVIWL